MIDAGEEQMEQIDDFIEVTSAFENFGIVSKKLEELEFESGNHSLQRIHVNTAILNAKDDKKVLRLVERPEEDDDVQNVYHILEITPGLEVVLSEE
jgi:transcriptional/translational regulatory protein YebC/TACO1